MSRLMLKLSMVSVSTVALACAVAAVSKMTRPDEPDREQAAAVLDRLPLATRHLRLTPGSHDEFLKAVATFAQANQFAILVQRELPDQRYFVVQLWRSDIQLILVNSADPAEVGVGAYAICLSHPPSIDFAEQTLEELELHVAGVVAPTSE